MVLDDRVVPISRTIASVGGALSWTAEGNVIDKCGPLGSGGRKRCRLDAVCAQAAKVMGEYCDGCKFSTLCVKLSRRESVRAVRQQLARCQLCSVILISKRGE